MNRPLFYFLLQNLTEFSMITFLPNDLFLLRIIAYFAMNFHEQILGTLVLQQAIVQALSISQNSF